MGRRELDLCKKCGEFCKIEKIGEIGSDIEYWNCSNCEERYTVKINKK